jgi:hypothetical protein
MGFNPRMTDGTLAWRVIGLLLIGWGAWMVVEALT